MKSLRILTLAFLFVASGLVYVPGAEAQSLVTLTEDFEDDVILDPPTADWYTFSAVGVGAFIIKMGGPTNSTLAFEHSPSDGTARSRFNLGTIDLCSAGNIKFSIMYQGSVTGANQPTWMFSAAERNVQQVEASDGYAVFISDTNFVTLTIANGAGAQTISSGVTLAEDTWLDIELRDVNCALATGRLVIPSAGASVAADTTDGIPNLSHFTLTHNVDNSQNLNDVWFDNMTLEDVPPPPPPVVGSADSVSLGSIISGDVSPDGNTVIVRRGSPTSAVETYQAYNLTNQIGADNGSFCNRLGGVSATNAYMIYTGCSVTATTVDRIYVRDPDLVTATVQGCQTCPDTIATGGAFDVADFMNDVYSSSLFGLGSGSGNEEISMVFGYTTSTGRIGVAGYMVNQNGADDDDFAEVAYGSGSPSDSCFTILSDGTKIIGAVSSTQATKFYSVQSQRNALAGLPDTITVGLSLYLSNTGTYGQGNAIACLGDFALISSGSQVFLVNLLTKAVVGAPIAEAAQQKGLAINQDGAFAAIATGSDVQIYNLTSRLPVASFAYPTGNFKSIDMDGPGANAWVFMNGTIARFAVADQTCGTACEDATTGTPGIPASTGGFSSDVKANTAAALGISEASAGAMATMLIMVIDASFFAVPVFFASKNAVLTMWAGYAGAVGGLVLAFAIGLAPGWLVTLMGVILVATAVLMVYIGARR